MKDELRERADNFITQTQVSAVLQILKRKPMQTTEQKRGWITSDEVELV